MLNNRTSALITLSNPRSPISEAYRALRTNIEFSTFDKKLRTLVVTSPSPEEGKSTTLANLAVTMAQSGKQVILVDCDLRKPSQHLVFGARNDRGLTSLMIPDAPLDKPPLQPTAQEGLMLLTAGPLPPNPSEMLGSKRMDEIIAVLSERADIVIFDAPPILAVTDAAVLATRVDGVLLVINAGRTKRDHMQRAHALLSKVNARLIGAVLNNVKFDQSLHKYYGEE
ncbi:MAG: CpsD/CapB family tyrosine-protein kinase [Chloroflexi bacterium]|nr:CpsD/CapB family tyrosine-protein kinase [Chloroflexota bacterium]MBI3734367.1 CpsD/CapB family tyrosine-protein kinase [Chloroflexota bacterium]